MKRRMMNLLPVFMLAACFLLLAALLLTLWRFVPRAGVRYGLLGLFAGVAAVAGSWVAYQRWQVYRFADELCETLDALLSGKAPSFPHPYEDSLAARVQGKLLQYSEMVNDLSRRSQQDKQTIQSLVSDISHQVKTPLANMKMFTDILQNHSLSPEKQGEFLAILSAQVGKLDFLMQSLIKMSRLETGTFALHMQHARLSDTIAQAMSTVWAKAEQKGITLHAACADDITVRHDPKWTAEALGNMLDNAVKYTPSGGCVCISVRPWHFYTRIDLSDTGMGIQQEHFHDVFKRFYRAPEAAAQEGIGLGLYLANGIITRQKGYISVASEPGKGTTFSVYLLS